MMTMSAIGTVRFGVGGSFVWLGAGAFGAGGAGVADCRIICVYSLPPPLGAPAAGPAANGDGAAGPAGVCEPDLNIFVNSPGVSVGGAMGGTDGTAGTGGIGGAAAACGSGGNGAPNGDGALGVASNGDGAGGVGAGGVG